MQGRDRVSGKGPVPEYLCEYVYFEHISAQQESYQIPCSGSKCEYSPSLNPQLKGILAESCYLIVLCAQIPEF